MLTADDKPSFVLSTDRDCERSALWKFQYRRRHCSPPVLASAVAAALMFAKNPREISSAAQRISMRGLLHPFGRGVTSTI
jgi:hypothetical protein